MNKSERHIITAEQGAGSSEQRIAKAREEYKRDSARLTVFLHLTVLFFVAAVALWMVSHWWFGVIFTDSHPASDSRMFYVMNMWNVLMYFMPGMFAALSAGCLAVALVFESLELFSLYITLLWQKCCMYRQSRLRREVV
ncbi:hypothetical protein P4S07_023470 [Serratia marcescens]|uniref:hypothetical protein n=1 Tax=Serratia marcescens TaxID=615 RepID=UPI002406D607|nr:hypothetical protein [Serratia marcescens]MDF9722723.1 hypothetical protein [Serratia marcescens]